MAIMRSVYLRSGTILLSGIDLAAENLALRRRSQCGGAASMPKTQAPITRQTPSAKTPNPRHSGPHVFSVLGIMICGLFGS